MARITRLCCVAGATFIVYAFADASLAPERALQNEIANGVVTAAREVAHRNKISFAVGSAVVRRVHHRGDMHGASLVMADQRNVLEKDPTTVRMQDLSFIDVSVLLNYRYAKQHGYHFSFYKMPDEKTCSHSVHGPRHPSWCKLVSFVHAQKQHPHDKYRAYLDSDFFVQHPEISIDQMLEAAVPEVPSPNLPNGDRDCTICEGSKCQEHVQQGDAWLTTNHMGLLGAFVLLRGGEKGDDILKKIWNSGSGEMTRFNQGFPWEQVAWGAAYNRSLHSDRRIVGIAGLDATWTGHQPPTRCNQHDGGISLDVWAKHSCHFDDDIFLMCNHGDRAARERIRKVLGCGPTWNTTRKLSSLTKEDGAKIDHHNLYAGSRKMAYLDVLRATIDDHEFRQLYTEAYHTKVVLSSADMERLGKEIELPMEQAGLLNLQPDQSSLYDEALQQLETAPRSVADPIPKGSRERTFWCDGPSV